jgi:hypothetical protein
MNRIAIGVTASAFALALACSPRSSTAPQPAVAPVRGKPTAPVSVAAELSAGSGRVTVRFAAGADDVRVEVRGAGGLAVTSGAVPVEGASFARGDAATFDVSFTLGPGRSELAVAVSGTFPGLGRRARIASFAVGEPTSEQRKAGGTVVEGDDGERIKVVGSSL